jgi:hypothetical protein
MTPFHWLPDEESSLAPGRQANREYDLNGRGQPVVCSIVSKLTKVMVVVALALWGLATMHCDLEQVPGFKFLAWCHPQDAAPQQGQDCGGDACSEVESALYKVEQHEVVVPTPALALSFLLPAWEMTTALSEPQPVRLDFSPPELPRLWQFFYRTALPPRAPSLLA